MRTIHVLAAIPFMLMIMIPAADGAEMHVSAGTSGSHFAGSMIVEVMVSGPESRQLDGLFAQPDVTVNGKSLHMVHARDGNWYAYFANADHARAADSTVGHPGTGLDFGVFCGSDTDASVFGVSFDSTRGFAVPRSGGLQGFADGDDALSACTGAPEDSALLNNVVRRPVSMNVHAGIPPGQIGLDENAWPVVQLFSFADVTIRYGSSQEVRLAYDEIPDISFNVDREAYPAGAEVFLTINDAQLNQDPTDEDSWTFGTGDSPSLFYMAFDASGRDDAAGGPGLVDLRPHLGALGFTDNGMLSIDPGIVLDIGTNGEQRRASMTDGTRTFHDMVTLVETDSNTGMFDTVDDDNDSSLGILRDAPRGRTGVITYNDRSMSVLTGSSDASLALKVPAIRIGDGTAALSSGQRYTVTLSDPDQNTDSGTRDVMDASDDRSPVPVLYIGRPVTLGAAAAVTVHDDMMHAVPSYPADPASGRLVIDAASIRGFDAISLDLGITVSDLARTLIDPSDQTVGTNWLNYDLGSIADAGADLSDASVMLSFGERGSDPITIAGPGMPDAGLLQLDDHTVRSILERSGSIFVTIHLGSGGAVPGGPYTIILDVFSFGIDGTKGVNNSVYRLEMKETSADSAVFEGALGYIAASRSDTLDPSFIRDIRTIDDDILFIMTAGTPDDADLTLSYSDLGQVGIRIVSETVSIGTHTGVVTLDSHTLRFGGSVTITLVDPDLNQRGDIMDAYYVVDDPGSPAVDTIGSGDTALLEVLIKGHRYQRCIVDGVEHGGLASSGFSLAETGPATGVFKGILPVPSNICNRDGSAIISSGGGSLDVRYFDSSDDSGVTNTVRLSRPQAPSVQSAPEPVIPPAIDPDEITRPVYDRAAVRVSGEIRNHDGATPVLVVIDHPDGYRQTFEAGPSPHGMYAFTAYVDPDSLYGEYNISLSYGDLPAGTVSFEVLPAELPKWFRSTASSWLSADASYPDFARAVAILVGEGLLDPPDVPPASAMDPPLWFKDVVRWWSEGSLSDEDLIRSIQYLVDAHIIRV